VPLPPFTTIASLAREAIITAATVQEYKLNKRGWRRFASHIQQVIALVIASALQQLEDNLGRMEPHLSHLLDVLSEIQRELGHMESLSIFRRLREEPKAILDYEHRLGRALDIFKLQRVLKFDEAFSNILSDSRSILSDIISVKRAVQRVDAQVSHSYALASDIRVDVKKVHHVLSRTASDVLNSQRDVPC